MRRRWGQLIGSVALVLAMVGGTLVASAPAASAYGPRPPTCTITVNVTITRAGLVVRLTGHCGILNDVLVFRIHSTPQILATRLAMHNGNYALPVTIPPNTDPGQHFLTVSDATPTRTYLTAVTGIIVLGPGATDSPASNSGTTGSASGSVGSGASGSSGSSGALAFTGLDPSVLLALAAAAVGLGGMLVLSSRKRRRRLAR